MKIADFFNFAGAAMGMRTETNSIFDTNNVNDVSLFKPIPEKINSGVIEAMSGSEIANFLLSKNFTTQSEKISRIITKEDLNNAVAKAFILK